MRPSRGAPWRPPGGWQGRKHCHRRRGCSCYRAGAARGAVACMVRRSGPRAAPGGDVFRRTGRGRKSSADTFARSCTCPLVLTAGSCFGWMVAWDTAWTTTISTILVSRSFREGVEPPHSSPASTGPVPQHQEPSCHMTRTSPPPPHQTGLRDACMQKVSGRRGQRGAAPHGDSHWELGGRAGGGGPGNRWHCMHGRGVYTHGSSAQSGAARTAVAKWP